MLRSLLKQQQVCIFRSYARSVYIPFRLISHLLSSEVLFVVSLSLNSLQSLSKPLQACVPRTCVELSVVTAARCAPVRGRGSAAADQRCCGAGAGRGPGGPFAERLLPTDPQPSPGHGDLGSAEYMGMDLPLPVVI